MNTLTTSPPQGPMEAVRQRATPVRVFLTLAVLLLAIATFVVTSLAVFTDTESIGGNVFSTGTVDISTSTATALVTITGMVPGDQDTAPLTVTNSGTLDLRYAVESTTTENPLAAELVLTVKEGVTACTDANWGDDGTTLYTGILGNTTGIAVFGDSAQGAQAGDRVLTESGPGDNEVLCVNVTFPLSATAGAGLSTTATFDFIAEQVDNNP